MKGETKPYFMLHHHDPDARTPLWRDVGKTDMPGIPSVRDAINSKKEPRHAKSKQRTPLSPSPIARSGRRPHIAQPYASKRQPRTQEQAADALPGLRQNHVFQLGRRSMPRLWQRRGQQRGSPCVTNHGAVAIAFSPSSESEARQSIDAGTAERSLTATRALR